MAKLHRFIKLNDRFDSQVFTFMLPAKLVTENNPDTYTKDVTYGYHKWTAIFTRSNVHLGCFLKLMSGCEGMKCQIDFSYTLLNREHFTRNETFIEKGGIFTTESTQHGRKNFVALGEMVERDFAQASGEFLIELEMRKISCSFECYIRLPRETQNTRYSGESRLESSYFSYGLCDWSISLSPNEGSVQQDEHVTLQLHRHTSFDHICNVRYYITLGENGAFQSEELDQLVDTTGNGEMYVINGSVHRLASGRSSLRMKVTMVSVVTVSELTLNVASRSNSRAHLYDRDKQAWMMEADTTGKYLNLCLYYTDVTHVPRKYSRYVCWNILVLTRYIPEHKVKTNYGPFSRYYVQQELDEGYHIYTTIPVDELHDERCLYTEPDDPRITVHIEWVDSHLLAQPSYNAHDDIDKLQKHQMKREIIALQSENLALEKQLLIYQQSLAKTTEKDKEKDKDKKREKKTPGNVVEKTHIRDQRLNEKATPTTTPSHTPTERKSSRDESGYYSDKTGGFHNGKTSTTHSEKSSFYYGDTGKTSRDGSYIGDTVSTGGGYVDRTTGGDVYSDKIIGTECYFDKTTGGGTYGDKISSRDSSSYIDKTTGGVTYCDKISSRGSSSYVDKTAGGGIYSNKKSSRDSSSYIDKTTGGGTYGDKISSRDSSSYIDKPAVGGIYGDKITTSSSYVDKPSGVGSYGDKISSSSSYFEKTGGVSYDDKLGSSSGSYVDKTSTGGGSYSDKMSRDSYVDKTSGGGSYGDKLISGGSSYVDKTGGYYGEKTTSSVGYVKKSSSSGYYSDRTDGNGQSVEKTSRSTGYEEKTNGRRAQVDKSSGSGYHSDRSERSYYKEKVPTDYCDRPRSERPRNERRRSSHRDGREKSHDRSSTSSNDRLSYRYR